MEQSECESVRVEQEGRDDDGDGTNEHEDDAKKRWRLPESVVILNKAHENREISRWSEPGKWKTEVVKNWFYHHLPLKSNDEVDAVQPPIWRVQW